MNSDSVIAMQMATMRCLECGASWEDLDAAVSQYPTACPECSRHRTEPAYNVDGTLMSDGWMWS